MQNEKIMGWDLVCIQLIQGSLISIQALWVCDIFNENVFTKFIHLNIWSLVGETVCNRLDLVEEIVSIGVACEGVKRLCHYHLAFSTSAGASDKMCNLSHHYSIISACLMPFYPQILSCLTFWIFLDEDHNNKLCFHKYYFLICLICMEKIANLLCRNVLLNVIFKMIHCFYETLFWSHYCNDSGVLFSSSDILKQLSVGTPTKVLAEVLLFKF